MRHCNFKRVMHALEAIECDCPSLSTTYSTKCLDNGFIVFVGFPGPIFGVLEYSLGLSTTSNCAMLWMLKTTSTNFLISIEHEL